MNIINTVRQFADQIGGQFTDYDHSRSVIVVPLSSSRFQTVLARTQKSPTSGKDQAVFTSKVCQYHPQIDLRMLMEQNATFDYSKFVLEDGYLKVEATCPASGVSEAQVHEMIQEVARLADLYEYKLTGQDIH